MTRTRIAKIVSIAAVGATIIPSILFLAGAMGHETVKPLALFGTIAWFLATPLWMSRKLPVDAAEVEI